MPLGSDFLLKKTGALRWVSLTEMQGYWLHICKPGAPKTMKNKRFGHLETRFFTIKTSKNVGLGGPWYILYDSDYIYTWPWRGSLAIYWYLKHTDGPFFPEPQIVVFKNTWQHIDRIKFYTSKFYRHPPQKKNSEFVFKGVCVCVCVCVFHRVIKSIPNAMASLIPIIAPTSRPEAGLDRLTPEV